jgi:hypothetical protein
LQTFFPKKLPHCKGLFILVGAVSLEKRSVAAYFATALNYARKMKLFRSLVALYEANDKPADALSFVRNNFAGQVSIFQNVVLCHSQRGLISLGYLSPAGFSSLGTML